MEFRRQIQCDGVDPRLNFKHYRQTGSGMIELEVTCVGWRTTAAGR
jgi:hypothetical protein